MTIERIRHPQKLADRTGEPDTHEVSFVALFDGWGGDLERLHASLVRHLGAGDWELVVIDNPGDDEASQRIAHLDAVAHVPLRDRVGWAAGRNLGLRCAMGRIVVVIDTSVELEGDALAPIARHLDDPEIGLVGAWGITTADGFHFEESSGPDVDGVEAYVMAMRRADLTRTGLFHPKFTWYRNADLDFSFQVRASGLRTIVDPSLPMLRHTHRLWEATEDARRDELSRRNFFRFREHWGDRADLFVSRS